MREGGFDMLPWACAGPAAMPTEVSMAPMTLREPMMAVLTRLLLSAGLTGTPDWNARARIHLGLVTPRLPRRFPLLPLQRHLPRGL